MSLATQVTVRRSIFTGSIARSANLPVFSLLSEADFEVIRPARATRCTDGGEIWHGGGDRTSFMPNFTPIGATTRL